MPSLLHDIDSPDDLGEGCSVERGCVGFRASSGISRGSEGTGSLGWEVDVVGMLWLDIVRSEMGRGRGVTREAGEK